ncbi:MAG: hypothetical protein ACREFR_01150, partial [Limisphaerales bacterium]
MTPPYLVFKFQLTVAAKDGSHRKLKNAHRKTREIFIFIPKEQTRRWNSGLRGTLISAEMAKRINFYQQCLSNRERQPAPFFESIREQLFLQFPALQKPA